MIFLLFLWSLRENKREKKTIKVITQAVAGRSQLVTSLKKKASERPALPPRPTLTNPAFRRNSNSRSVDNSSISSRATHSSSILRKNSSDQINSPVMSPVTPGISDNVTSPDKTFTSVQDSPNSSFETTTAVYKPHYPHNTSKIDYASASVEEVDTLIKTDPVGQPDVIPKPQTLPMHKRPSEVEIWGPPTSLPPDPPSKVNMEMFSSKSQSSEQKKFPPSTPPEDPQSSPPSSLSEPELLEESISESSKGPSTKIRSSLAKMEGTLEIKLKQGGNKGSDHWETVYAVLEEETLNLFKDQDAANENCTRWPPITLVGAVCKDNPFYRRKEHTFKLILADGSHYLFAASSREEQQIWLKELQDCTNETTSSDSPGTSTEASNETIESCDSGPTGTFDTQASNTESNQEKEESTENCETDKEPPPKPPHTYYNKHRYPDGASESQHVKSLQRNQAPPFPPPPPPVYQTENGTKDRSKNKSVFKKFFKK
nr:spectrin beta chain, non-erythrocytic 1-like isoform X2 [Misgurnus anguillicaudatus]